MPIFKGSLIGAIPIVSILALGKAIFNEKMLGLYGIKNQWDPIIVTDAESELTYQGRTGFMYFGIGFMFIFIATTLLIPQPSEADESLILYRMLTEKRKRQNLVKREREDDESDNDSFHSGINLDEIGDSSKKINRKLED